jgi:hypothetical protein
MYWNKYEYLSYYGDHIKEGEIGGKCIYLKLDGLKENTDVNHQAYKKNTISDLGGHNKTTIYLKNMLWEGVVWNHFWYCTWRWTQV